ncbi:uncharacterized protein [Coffea arabica]|uniref:Uncharacterized protein isoform X2 n=1 Tax=Coffea arabica TaxID=13443 RepID=A0ABM4WIN7_COFAR
MNSKTINITISPPSNFRYNAPILHPFFYFPRTKPKFQVFLYSRSHSISSKTERGGVKALPSGAGEAVNEVSQNRLIQVVLVSPQIPGNTGCIARTCAASAVGLHLVEPLGFQVDDTKLKRAGLDYWPYVVVKVHGSWGEFRDYFSQQEVSYRKGDWLVFGSETSGLPPEALLDCKTEPHGGGAIRIPMVETYVRCLNLSVSVGIALYEASRQLNYEQLQCPSEPYMDTESSFVTEDIFA